LVIEGFTVVVAVATAWGATAVDATMLTSAALGAVTIVALSVGVTGMARF
jgi:hypothetical protein